MKDDLCGIAVILLAAIVVWVVYAIKRGEKW